VNIHLDDFLPPQADIHFAMTATHNDDELVAVLAQADTILVTARDEEAVPDEIQDRAQRALLVAGGTRNGVVHSTREKRHAALALMAAAETYFAAPAALVLVPLGGELEGQRICVVTPAEAVEDAQAGLA
jgi:hypothetical protein